MVKKITLAQGAGGQLMDQFIKQTILKSFPNHHRVILALSTAFWDAWLRKDAAARAWLDGDGPRSILEKADRWQKK